jgi:hypothetical protein
MDRQEALEAVRKKMREKKGTRAKDPMQFVPPQVKPNEVFKYKFYVLPQLQADDVCATGKASRSMDLWYTTAGTHWINKKPLECPRIHDNGKCKFCQLGFDLLSETDDEVQRKNIVKTYLARSSYVVNIYFPPYSSTPQELRGKVMWYAMPKTVFDIMEATVMRDASADELDPQAYGLFYSPENAYVFQLEIKHQGNYNDYKQSKFLHSSYGPMIKNKDGDLDASMPKVLAQRHDLFLKFAERDGEALAKLADQVLKGEPESDRSMADASSTTETQPVNDTSSVPNTTSSDSGTLIDEPEDTSAQQKTKLATTQQKQVAKPATTVKQATLTAQRPVQQKPASDTPDDEELTRLLADIRDN